METQSLGRSVSLAISDMRVTLSNEQLSRISNNVISPRTVSTTICFRQPLFLLWRTDNFNCTAPTKYYPATLHIIAAQVDNLYSFAAIGPRPPFEAEESQGVFPTGIIGCQGGNALRW